MRWYERVIAAHTAVTDEVSHYEHMQSDRHFVWQEDGSNNLKGGNALAEQVITGTTDLFTKREFDPWFDEIQQAFDAQCLAWSHSSTQYEEETGFIHHEWEWEALDGTD